MFTEFSTVTWEEALRSFLLYLKTIRFYATRLSMLVRWANESGLSLSKFFKRHPDEYSVYRQEGRRAKTTLHHDTLTAPAQRNPRVRPTGRLPAPRRTGAESPDSALPEYLPDHVRQAGTAVWKQAMVLFRVEKGANKLETSHLQLWYQHA